MNDNNKTYIAMYFYFDIWGTPHYTNPYIAMEDEPKPIDKKYYGNNYVLYSPYSHKIMGNNPTVLQKHIKHLAFNNVKKLNNQIQFLEAFLENLTEEEFCLREQYQASLNTFKRILKENYNIYKILSEQLKTFSFINNEK